MGKGTTTFGSGVMRIIQRDLHAQLRAEVIQARDRIAALVRPLNGAQLNEHPEPKGWSIAQVLEHLLVADERSSAPAMEVTRTARPDAVTTSCVST